MTGGDFYLLFLFIYILFLYAVKIEKKCILQRSKFVLGIESYF